MGKNIFKSLVWMGLYMAASTVGAFVAIFAYMLGAFFGVIDTEPLSSMTDPTEMAMELVSAVVVPSLIIAAIICIGVFVIYKKSTKRPLDIKTVQWDKALFCVGVGLLLNAAISGILSLIASLLPDSLTGSLDSSTNMALTGSFLVVFLGTGILVPIMEEIIFRYGVHQTLARSNLAVAYVVSSLIFGAAHGNLIQGTYATILGLIFAFIYTKTNNIWYPIIIHMTINSSSTIATFATDVSEMVFVIGMLVVSVTIIVPLLWKRDGVRALFKKDKKAILVAEEVTV